MCVWQVWQFAGAETWSGLWPVGNGSLTESIIASIEEENALNPKLDNKKSDKAVPFLCFSTETGQDTMKELQGASTAENT